MNVLIAGLTKLLHEDDINNLNTMGYQIAFKSAKDDFNNPSWPEVMIIYQFTQSQPISEFSNLKIIQTTSTGFNHLDLEYIKKHRIKLLNARGVHGISISEYVLGKILEVYKKSKYYQGLQNQKIWDSKSGLSALYQRKAAILGTGSIGQEIAKRLQAFEVHVSGFNTNGRPIPYFDNTHPLVTFSDYAKKYDIVVCALPLNKETYHFLNHQRLSEINKQALLINIGRGPIIDEHALIEVLKTHFQAVILDVFEVEPLPQESPLWHHPKVIVTPHNSYNDPTTKFLLRQLILKNLTALANNQPLINQVPLEE